MDIKHLKEIVNAIPSELNDLTVWIDTDESEGGRIVNDVQLKYAEDCCLDGDEGSETLYADDVCEMFGIDELPEPETIEFNQIICKLTERHYRWEGDDRFSRQILAIKF